MRNLIYTERAQFPLLYTLHERLMTHGIDI